MFLNGLICGDNVFISEKANLYKFLRLYLTCARRDMKAIKPK